MLNRLRHSMVMTWHLSSRVFAVGLLALVLAGFAPQAASAASRSAPTAPRVAAATSCRPTTQLSLQPGVFTDVRAFINALDGNIVLQYTINSRHQLRLGTNIASCPNNYDGYYLRSDLSNNLCAVAGPQYVPSTGQIQLEVFPCNPTKNIVVGFRFKFEEDYNVTFQDKPRKVTAQTTIYLASNARTPATTSTTVFDETP